MRGLVVILRQGSAVPNPLPSRLLSWDITILLAECTTYYSNA